MFDEFIDNKGLVLVSRIDLGPVIKSIQSYFESVGAFSPDLTLITVTRGSHTIYAFVAESHQDCFSADIIQYIEQVQHGGIGHVSHLSRRFNMMRLLDVVSFVPLQEFIKSNTKTTAA